VRPECKRMKSGWIVVLTRYVTIHFCDIIHIYLQTNIVKYVRTYIVYIHVCIHTYIHTMTHIHTIHTYMYTYMYLHTYMHTYYRLSRVPGYPRVPETLGYPGSDSTIQIPDQKKKKEKENNTNIILSFGKY